MFYTDTNKLFEEALLYSTFAEADSLANKAGKTIAVDQVNIFALAQSAIEGAVVGGIAAGIASAVSTSAAGGFSF